MYVTIKYYSIRNSNKQDMSHWFHRNCLKATGPLDTKHLTPVLTSQKANQIVNELKQKRAQLVSKMGDLLSDPRSTPVIEEYLPLIRGFAQSVSGAASPLQNLLKFRWTQSLGGRNPEVQNDAVFEIANVCVNIGLWYMKRAAKIASSNNYAEAEAKEVHTCLRTAAGIFEYVLDKVSPHLDSSKLEDWFDITVPILTAYKLECTAEAQEVTVARAIELKHKPDLISALAHETSKLFSDADTALRECDVEFVTKWRRYLQVKIKFYAAYARSFQGEYLLTLDKCGDSIKTLREAQKLYKEAQGLCKQYEHAPGNSVGEVRPARHPFFQKLGPVIDLRLSKSERENGFIYYQKIPEELPELELKATFGLAAPIPFEMPEVHAIFTEEAYKDFTVQETAPPKISGSDKDDLPPAKETDIGGDTKNIDNDSGCVIQ
ncbi:hypothetical protein ACHWQZ_G008721 [Mnemiopsis leidyi]